MESAWDRPAPCIEADSDRPGELVARAACRLGVVLRTAQAADFAQMRALALAAFTQPRGYLEHPGATRHYRPDLLAGGETGNLSVMVAVDAAGAVVAHCYLFVRDDGNLHIREIAALPRSDRRKVARAAALLLAWALLTYGAQAARVSLRVEARHRVRVSPGPGRAAWRDPSEYYRRLGFEQSLEPGLDSMGRPLRAGDLAMEVSSKGLRDRLMAFVGHD